MQNYVLKIKNIAKLTLIIQISKKITKIIAPTQCKFRYFDKT